MAPELLQNLIQHLIEIGTSGRFEEGEKIPSLFPSARAGSFMRLTPHSWYEVAVSLDDAQLIACIKALTVLERLPNFGAGSVSPVIWLFRKLSERSHDDLTSVIDWVLSHTDNPYLPFGSHNLGAHSLPELHALSARAAERAKARYAAEENCQREAKVRKVAEATHKLFGALRRRDEKAVVALISQGADIYASNDLEQTAFEYARSLGLQHLLTPIPTIPSKFVLHANPFEGRITEVTASLNERFMKSVGCHFVTLSCVQTVPGTTGEKILVFSGFLADVNGVWFYVTAGHILRRIRSALNAGAKFDIWRLGDQTAGNRFNDTAIPFAFDLDRWCVIENEAIGLDYATLPLDEMYCRALQAGGAIPIDKSDWGDHVTEHDHWALVGIPSETVSYDGKTIITARVVVAPLEPTEEPAEAGPKAQNQFYGRLKDDSVTVVKDIDGMSGGPIFALKKIEGTWKYSVIGVQSAWYQPSRVIAACPFSSFALELEQLVADALSSQGTVEGKVI